MDYKISTYMRAQLQRLGLAMTGIREIATCKPITYRWGQLVVCRVI